MHLFTAVAVEESDANRFIIESNKTVIENCVDGKDPDDPDELPTVNNTRRNESSLATGLGSSINFSLYIHQLYLIRE